MLPFRTMKPHLSPYLPLSPSLPLPPIHCLIMHSPSIRFRLIVFLLVTFISLILVLLLSRLPQLRVESANDAILWCKHPRIGSAGQKCTTLRVIDVDLTTLPNTYKASPIYPTHYYVLLIHQV